MTGHGRSGPVSAIARRPPNGRKQSVADIQAWALDGQLVSVGDIQAGAQAPPVAGTLNNPQVQVLVFRYTAPVAPGDSAHHAAMTGGAR